LVANTIHTSEEVKLGSQHQNKARWKLQSTQEKEDAYLAKKLTIKREKADTKIDLQKSVQ